MLVYHYRHHLHVYGIHAQHHLKWYVPYIVADEVTSRCKYHVYKIEDKSMNRYYYRFPGTKHHLEWFTPIINRITWGHAHCKYHVYKIRR